MARHGGKPPVSEDQKRVYLQALADGHTKSTAAAMAGAARSTFFRMAERDEAFAADQEEAYTREGRDKLVETATHRAIDGWEEPVYQGGKLVGMIRKYDHRLLELLIKQRDPSFRDRSSVELTGKDGGAVKVEHKERLTLEDLARFAARVESDTGSGGDAGG